MKSLIRNITQLRFIRPELKRRLLNLTYPLNTVGPKPFTVRMRGLTYSGDLSNAQDYIVYFYGSYEPYELDLIELLTDRINDCVCFDIGCNMGQHTLVMSKRAKSVYAFDPLHAVSAIADRRAKANGKTNIRFFPFGLGDENSSEEFFFDPSSRNNAMGSFVKGHDPSAQSVGRLDIRQGDDFIQSEKLDKLDFIKIDIEGFEGAAIKGLENGIARLRPFIMMEISNTAFDLFDRFGTFEFLAGENYDILEIEKVHPVLGLFERGRLTLKPLDQVRANLGVFNILCAPKEKRNLVETHVSTRWPDAENS
ncbi:MAG: FkbM family methyltransferase [Rhizobiaceae bacterium]|nr:FkbM family methyltransferase [Rhizobiaceae bacterium]